MSGSGWLTIEQAAQRVSRDESTIRRWLRNGLPSIVGRIAEAKLLDYDRTMRESRGRPRKVDPAVPVDGEAIGYRRFLVLVEGARRSADADVSEGRRNLEEWSRAFASALYSKGIRLLPTDGEGAR